MKKYYYIFSLLIAQGIQNLYAAQIARTLQRAAPLVQQSIPQLAQVQNHLHYNQQRQKQLRKALYLKCGAGALLLGAAVAIGYSYAHSKSPATTSYPTATIRPPQIRVVPVQAAAPAVSTATASIANYYGMAKLAGLCGTVVGLVKSCGSLWQEFKSFWAIKEDIKAGLKQQEEILTEQKITQATLENVQEILQQRDLVDAQRWQDNQETLQKLQAEQEQISARQEVYEGNAYERYTKLKKMLKACHEEQRKLASAEGLNKNTDRLTALEEQIKKLVMLLTSFEDTQQPGTLS